MRAALIALLPLFLATTATAENTGDKLSRGAVGQHAARHYPAHHRGHHKRTTHFGGHQKKGETGGDGSAAGGYGYKGGKKCKHRPMAPAALGDNQVVANEQTPPATSDAAEPTSAPSEAATTEQPATTEEASSTSPASSVPTSYAGGEMHKGEATFFDPIKSGVPNACGGSDDNTESWIIAVDKSLFNSYPGATGASNENPICGKKVKIWYEPQNDPENKQETTATITDMCVGCGYHNIDVTHAIMRSWLPDYEAKGIANVTWTILD